jgi:hypothetical protein
MAMVYDAAHGEVVLFGGAAGGFVPLGDTWTWDGAKWTERHPATSPAARWYSGMTYDAAHGEVVLFGGYGSDYLGDTWTWDGTTWTEQHPATSPSARSGMGMTYDAARDQVVLFGGDDGSRHSDTWTWDGTNWTLRHPGAFPQARYITVATYDAARGKVLLFGGYDGIGCCLSDTWTWDGTTWTQQHPTTFPPGRFSSGMTFDAAEGDVVLFGGFDSQQWGVRNDTWTWDGTTWTEQHPATSPSDRGGVGTTYDAARGEMLLFGGAGGCCPGPLLGDTWTRDAESWRVPFVAHVRLSPNSGPPGTTVQVKGTGFAAFERMTIRFVDSVTGKTGLQKLKTDATGSFTTQVTVPADATAGAQKITASGWRSGQHVKAKFTVT